MHFVGLQNCNRIRNVERVYIYPVSSLNFNIHASGATVIYEKAWETDVSIFRFQKHHLFDKQHVSLLTPFTTKYFHSGDGIRNRNMVNMLNSATHLIP